MSFPLPLSPPPSPSPHSTPSSISSVYTFQVIRNDLHRFIMHSTYPTMLENHENKADNNSVNIQYVLPKDISICSLVLLFFSVCLSVSPYLPPSLFLSTSTSISTLTPLSLSIYLCISLSIYIYIYHYISISQL